MLPNIISNPIIDKLPAHLHQYIKPQNYEHYTPIDQAVWRYVMRKNVDYLKTVAHDSYLEGLKQTGISVDLIPNMYGMNRILKKIGWAAVAVDGFIPPSAFMEFQAYNVLVIAADIRLLEHIEYTAAPDIIHESAGHAPIIANPEYAEYLRRIGEIGSKAISSAKDWEIYHAIRKLSLLKEQYGTPEHQITEAEKELAELQENMGAPSEMELIRNLHWWAVEYGLIGTLDDYKIYGAGLLSSIGESKWCMTDQVEKRPYTIETAYQRYDITKPQPQLFVTPDFAHLNMVLEEFANSMALRTGGLSGLQKLIDSQSLGTIELSTGLQISGVFTRVIPNESNGVAYIETKGLAALSYRERELIGHSTANYPEGFASPLGKLKGINLAIEDMSPRDLEAYNIREGKTVSLEFEGGIHISGEVITGTRNLQGKILLITFKNCWVKYHDQVLFQPDWGIYHLAVGKTVDSAFAGPADLTSFDLMTHTLSTIAPQNKSATQIRLEELYQTVREISLGNTCPPLALVFTEAKKTYSQEWLLWLEIYEAALNKKEDELAQQAKKLLHQLKEKRKEVAHLIEDGLELLGSQQELVHKTE